MTQGPQAHTAGTQSKDGEPSTWVRRFAPLVPAGGKLLDLACGAGRHSRLFLEAGHPVLAVDKDLSRIDHLRSRKELSLQAQDLEDGSAFPFPAAGFAGVVVTNYLHRPILPDIVRAVAPDGVLIYETFAQGNEAFGRPSNPDFLLKPGELLDAVAGQLRVMAYEDLTVEQPKPAAIQRMCARREA